MPLTHRQQLFVHEYCVDRNGTQAAIRAGYSPKGAEVQASVLLRKPKVSAAIERTLAQQAKRIDVSAARVLLEYARLAFADSRLAYGPDGKLLPMHRIPEDVRRAISSFECATSDGDDGPTRLTKVRLWPKEKALEALGRHLNLFVDKVSLEGDGGPVTITINRKVQP